MRKNLTLTIIIALIMISTYSTLLLAEDAPQNASAERMQWWANQKFGMFIHWGPLDVPRIRLESSRLSPEEKNKAYNDVYKNFNPTGFDADAWAKLAKDAGMRYVVLTAKHTVFYSFPLWATKTSTHSIINPECPYSKQENPDIIDKYVKALRKQDLAVGLYFTHGDRWHPDARSRSGHKDGTIEDFYKTNPDRWQNYLSFERDQLRELLTNYGQIDILWFDGWFKTDTEGLPLLKMMRQLQPNLIVNDRGTGQFADFVTPENCIPSMQIGAYWEPCITIAGKGGWIPQNKWDSKQFYTGGHNDWWYTGPNMQYKSLKELLQTLCTVVSEGGNLLLNIGPKPDGTIPEKEVELLEQMGKWLKVNGEAIYDTTRNPLNRVPSWGRITQKGQKLYLHIFQWPENAAPLNLNLINKIKSAKLLATGEDVDFNRLNSTAVELTMPTERISHEEQFSIIDQPTEPVSVIVLEVEGKINRSTGSDPITLNPDGEIVLHAKNAAIFGTPMKSYWGNLVYSGKTDSLVSWGDTKTYPQWGVFSPAAKKYNVKITYNTKENKNSNEYEVRIADKTIKAKTVPTEGNFRTFQLGQVDIAERHSVVAIKALATNGGFMDFRDLKLIPVE